MAKNIGGYCEKRTALIKILENLKQDEQYELSGWAKRCYECTGYDYDCINYSGARINLREDKI